MQKKILVVDDEPAIVKGLKFSLGQDGYIIDAAYDGEEAVEKFTNNQYDLIILDVMLPKMNGLVVLQKVREKSDIPVIMLTAKGEDMDKILGLEYGADDYLTKPFNILELKARVKAIFRGPLILPKRKEERDKNKKYDCKLGKPQCNNRW